MWIGASIATLLGIPVSVTRTSGDVGNAVKIGKNGLNCDRVSISIELLTELTIVLLFLAAYQFEAVPIMSA